MDLVFRMYIGVARLGINLLIKVFGATSRAVSGLIISSRTRGDLRPSEHDYRGVQSWAAIPKSPREEDFPLGILLDAGGRAHGRIALPSSAVAHNTCVVGPPGSGKTRFLVVPWIVAALRAGQSVVAIDVKGDLMDLVSDHVRQSGAGPVGVQARSFDYTRPARSLRWNWLDCVVDDRSTGSVVSALLGKEAPPKSDPYFHRSDSQVLRGLLELVRDSPDRVNVTTSRLLATLRDQGAIGRALSRRPGSTVGAGLRELMPLSPDDYARRISGVVGVLDPLTWGDIERVCHPADFTLDEIFREPNFVTLVAPLGDGQLATSISSLFVNELLTRAYARFTRQGGPHVLLVLDEAAQLADRVDYKNVLSVARQSDMSLLIAVQDVSQFADENERSAVFGNCGTYVSFSGVSAASAKLLSDRLGRHPMPTTTRNISPGTFGSQTGISRSMAMVPILGTREIMDIPFGRRSAIVHARDVVPAPLIVDLQ